MLLCPFALLRGIGQFKPPKPEVSPSRHRRRNDRHHGDARSGLPDRRPDTVEMRVSTPLTPRVSGKMFRLARTQVVSPLRQR